MNDYHDGDRYTTDAHYTWHEHAPIPATSHEHDGLPLHWHNANMVWYRPVAIGVARPTDTGGSA